MQSLLIAQLNPRDGEDHAFNAWYNDVHIPDILAMESVLAAQRFVRAEDGPAGWTASPYKYLAIIEVLDTARLAAELNDAYGTARMRQSDAVDPTNPSVFLFAPLPGATWPRGRWTSPLMMIQADERPAAARGFWLEYDRHWRFLDKQPRWPIAGLVGCGTDAHALDGWWPDPRRFVPGRSAGAQVTIYESLTARTLAPGHGGAQ